MSLWNVARFIYQIKATTIATTMTTTTATTTIATTITTTINTTATLKTSKDLYCERTHHYIGARRAHSH